MPTSVKYCALPISGAQYSKITSSTIRNLPPSLGVTISSEDQACFQYLQEGKCGAAFLRPNIRPASKKAKAIAYRTFVHPVLEYAWTTLAPHTENDINQTEMVQRRVARFVMGHYQGRGNVSTIRKHLSWETQQHRDQARLAMMYHIVHHLVNIPAEMYFTPLANYKTWLLIQVNPSLLCRLQIQLLSQNSYAMELASMLQSAIQPWRLPRTSWPVPTDTF